MRRITLTVLLILICSLLGASNVFALPVSTVILDAGHGGYDPGAVSYLGDEPLLEKDLTLSLAFRVGDVLKKEGSLEVLYTRTDDSFISLEQRLELANSVFPGSNSSALFVSLHFNSSPVEDPNGFEVLVKEGPRVVPFITSDSPQWRVSRFVSSRLKVTQQQLNLENLELARSVMDSFSRTFPDLRSRGVKEQDIYVLNGSLWPSILFEGGFISNTTEYRFLSDPQWLHKAGQAIAEGILDYIE
ncbi:MAG: N-acetylmuramoyl-L-alanine amidase [Sphaerochaetaceae bacterium]|nr:N-acetylmuramoyl-L-alanine amidase [Sphaerochaetaceae bacterium]